MERAAASAQAAPMWDVLEWHGGTLSIAWWAVLILSVALLGLASKHQRS
jgi:hypothetical protein